MQLHFYTYMGIEKIERAKGIADVFQEFILRVSKSWLKTSELGSILDIGKIKIL